MPETLPKGAEAELAEVLADPLFEQSRPSLWQKYMQQAWEWVIDRFGEVFRNVDFPEVEPSSWLSRFFESLGEFLYYGGKVLLGLLITAAVIGAAMLLWKFLKPHFAAKDLWQDEEPAPNTEPAAARVRISELLDRQAWREALEQVRRRLRRFLCRSYGYHLSLTDRELLRRLPDNDSTKPLFRQVARSFELLVYAGIPPDAEALHGLCLQGEKVLQEVEA